MRPRSLPAPRAEGILMGFSDSGGGQQGVRVLADDLVSHHGLAVGSSGSGKTVSVLALITQVLRERPDLPVIAVDPKGDLAKLRSPWLEALAGSLPPPQQQSFLANFRLVAPFRDPTLELNLLASTGDEPELQALDVADAIATGLDSGMGNYERMFATLTLALTAGIEAGLTLLDLPKLLIDPSFRLNVVSRLPRGRTKEMLEPRLKGTPSATIQAILARLDRLTASRISRQLLGAKGCFSWRDRLARGVTLVDLSNPPSGQSALTGLFGGFLASQLTKALLARPVDETTLPLWTVIDEVHELLSSRVGEGLGRLLALVRHRKVGIWLLYQDAVQLERRAPDLLPLLQANARHLLAFRGSPSNLKWMAPFLPPPTLHGASRHGAPPSRSAAGEQEQERRLLASMAAMPSRVALYVDRASGRPGAFVATPTIDFRDLERRARAAPEHVRRVLSGEATEPALPAPAALPPHAPVIPQPVPKNEPVPAPVPIAPLPAPTPQPAAGDEAVATHIAEPLAAVVEGPPPAVTSHVTAGAVTFKQTVVDAVHAAAPDGEARGLVNLSAYPSLGWFPWSAPPGGVP